MKTLILFCGFLYFASEATGRGQEIVDPSRWTANPSFFAARSKTERRQALELWITSIREQIQKPGITNVDDTIRKMQVQHIWRMAVPAFRPVFGKDYATLTENERKQIASELRSSNLASWAGSLAHSFEMPSNRGDGLNLSKEFEQYAKQPWSIRVQPSRQERLKFITENRLIAYGVQGAELLAGTARYNLYLGTCSPAEADVTIVFSIGPRENIANDDAYWRVFEQEMLPRIRKRCAAEVLKISHHVEGFYVSDRVVPLEQKTIAPETVEPSFKISSATYSASGQARREWQYGCRQLAEMGLANDKTCSSIATLQSKLNSLAVERTRQRVATGRRERQEKSLAGARAAAESRLDDAFARLRKELPAQREKAAWLLRLTEPRDDRPAAGAFSFAGYHQGDLLQKIYDGKFREVMPYEKVDTLDVQANLALDSLRRDLCLKLMYLTFHQVVGARCDSDPELKFEKVSIRYDRVYSRMMGVIEVQTDRREGSTQTFRLRTPYVPRFKELHENLNAGTDLEIVIRNLGFSSVEISQELMQDFQRFLAQEGCYSPQVRQFEANIFLLCNGMLSLQELRN